MNIGIVTTWFERGAAYVSRAYMKTLSRKYNVYIYARSGEKYAMGDPIWDKENVTWGKKITRKKVTYIDYADFKNWIDTFNIKIIIFNEQHSWEILQKIRSLNIIIGAYVDYYTPETVPFFWIYDFLLCNTKRHYNVFISHPQAFYIPWGTDISLFKPKIKNNNNNNNNKNFITFFHSSGLSPTRKGTDILVKAFQHVKGNAKLIIHSQGPFEIDSSIKKIIAENSHITVIEKEVGAPGLYHLGDVYVYPSYLEGIGLTIPEALSSGLPVITSDSPPMNEFIENGLNGITVKIAHYEIRSDNYYWPMATCDDSALTNAMQFYVDNIQYIQNYADIARDYAEKNLNWEKNSSCLLDIIGNLSTRQNSVNDLLLNQIKLYEKPNYIELLKRWLYKKPKLKHGTTDDQKI